MTAVVCINCGEHRPPERMDARSGWCLSCFASKCDGFTKRRLQPYKWTPEGRTREEEPFKQRAGYAHDTRLGKRARCKP